jgi:hypothetical protein
MGQWILESVKRSRKENKKWTAKFSKEGENDKYIDFGDPNYDDYTTIGKFTEAQERRKAYRARAKSTAEKADIMSPAALSYYILWGDYRNRGRNEHHYRIRLAKAQA